MKQKRGDWRWITGERVTYTNWQPGEPNDDDEGEDYAMMYKDGTWNDAGGPKHPDEAHYYVCEWG